MQYTLCFSMYVYLDKTVENKRDRAEKILKNLLKYTQTC